MENSDQQDELLIKYLANELNVEEQAFVERWIKASEDNLHYFEGLKSAWQLTSARHTISFVLDELNVDERWDRFKQNVTANEASAVPTDSQEQFENKLDDGEAKRRTFRYRSIVSAAVAASVITVLSLGILFFNTKENVQEVAIRNVKQTEATPTVTYHEVNSTGKEKSVQLADGSLVLLADKSEITYTAPFTTKRDIYLTGKAYFKVTKDPARPFTVFSGDISTTALGTEFSVTAISNEKKVTVYLYEGKVVVKPIDRRNKKMKRAVYLLPGQSFVYNDRLTRKGKVEKTSNDESNDLLARDNPLLPEQLKGTWYMFNNQQLAQVFDQLASIYNVEIIYNKKDLRNKFFVGKFNKSDSLDIILKYITIANKLSLTKNENTYNIHK